MLKRLSLAFILRRLPQRGTSDLRVRNSLEYTLVLAMALLTLGAPAQVGAQSPTATPLTGAVTAYQRIADSGSNAWNAGVNSAANPPQPLPVIGTNGFGQVNLPGIGVLTPTGSYSQWLYVPNGLPVFGGMNTGIQTTVNTYVDDSGNRVEAAVDPLSAFNYSLTHSSYAATQESGYALVSSVVANWLSGNSNSGSRAGTNDSALRADPGLVAALNSNFAQGLGGLFGVGVYLYPPDLLTGMGAATASDVPSGLPGNVPGVPDDVPITEVSLPPPPGLSSSGEEVYLKAVIPPSPPDFIIETQPPFPVVVGQDSTQRGVDVLGRATLYPCTVIWHHVLHEYYTYCPTKDNCEVIETTREWDTTELEPDALAAASIDSALTPKSATYIMTEMARIYPGSKIYQGQVRVYPSTSLKGIPGGWARVTENVIGIPSHWAFLAERVPYADPGDWDFQVALTTTGTPHCAPLNWSRDFSGLLTVWLREQRLVK